MQLADRWGCTVAEAQARCSSREFAMWEAWERLSPYEPDRQDTRIAVMAANLMAAMNKGTSYRVRDFMPVQGAETEPTKPQSEAEMKAMLNPIFARIGKRTKKPQG